MTHATIDLAYEESSIPAPSARERLDLARTFGLALELANTQSLEEGLYHDESVRICAVQAFQLHDVHPLHPDPQAHVAAAAHVRDTLEVAQRVGAPRIVTVCGFGKEIIDRPYERCLAFFGSLADAARDSGVRILIEPLSPLRADAMWAPDEILRLLGDLGDPEAFGLMLDTGHLADSGIDVDAFLAGCQCAPEEIQLRGAGSYPPRPDAPLAAWIDSLPRPPQVLCVEHRVPIDRPAWETLVAGLRSSLDAWAA